jgi:hypothetical protein
MSLFWQALLIAFPPWFSKKSALILLWTNLSPEERDLYSYLCDLLFPNSHQCPFFLVLEDSRTRTTLAPIAICKASSSSTWLYSSPEHCHSQVVSPEHFFLYHFTQLYKQASEALLFSNCTL